MIANAAEAFIMGHQGWFIGLAIGWILAHIPQIVLGSFKQAMKIPWVRGAVLKNPKQAKAIIDQIANELEKDIDEEVSHAEGQEQPAAMPSSSSSVTVILPPPEQK